MANLFQFTDAPDIDDVWETRLDVDVLINTRPVLMAERNRFFDAFGSTYARFELENSVYRGLKNYGYAHFPAFQEQINKYIEAFYDEAVDDAIQAYAILRAKSHLTAGIEARAHELLFQTLQTPELIAQFTNRVLLKLHTLDPMERLHEIYRLRAQLIAQNIPFSRLAPQLLDDYFHHHCPILALRAQIDLGAPAFDYLPKVTLCDELFTDTIHGLIHRLETNSDFLDTILAQWVLPELHERFNEIDHLLDHMQIDGKPIDRELLISRMKTHRTDLN